jgi:hypothetical protein
MNGAHGISDIEGKATRVGASERGQRTSFKAGSRFGSWFLISLETSAVNPTESIAKRDATLSCDI